ncbi:MAG TPA: alpha/beta hydrolase-fold protein [Hyphomonadaceae bacterium]|jgi:predicted alpha/beta superfamily hydrolase|nr:alpha/beta hydrolase-fold protein [Hyphomonadaceae bacterium]
MTACSARVSDVVFRDAGMASISTSQRFHVSMEGYKEQFRIDIAVPATPIPPGKKLPVIYVLDGAWSFAVTVQAARALAVGPGAIPQAIVVGIGPAIDGPAGFAATTALRYRDLAPGVDEAHIAQMKTALPAQFWPADSELGGAARFFRFIETELKPFVEAYFPVDTSDQTLVGVSLGGLFVLNTLFTAPGSFQRHVAVSPSIWWNGCAIEDREADAAMLGGVRARLFLGVGELEEGQAPEARMVSNLTDMADRLKAWPGLVVSSHVFEGEGHMSVPPAAISRGLRAVFAN